MFNAIILAAGLGSRLSNLTRDCPKCMIKVNDITIIENQIESLLENNVKKIIVIGGYNYEKLERFIYERFPNNPRIILINNDNYMKTNNMFSLYISKKYANNKNIILMNGDVFFDKSIITDLINSKYENQIICDDRIFNIESMKITIENDKIKSISKEINSNDSSGCSIDVYKFSKKATRKLFHIIKHNYIKNNKNNMWTELAINDLLNMVDVYPLYTNKRWYEIDNLEDLENACRVFKW